MENISEHNTSLLPELVGVAYRDCRERKLLRIADIKINRSWLVQEIHHPISLHNYHDQNHTQQRK